MRDTHLDDHTGLTTTFPPHARSPDMAIQRAFRKNRMKIHDPADNVWTAQQDEELKLQLANGRSINELALRMKRSPLAVRTRVNKLGIREAKKD
jgi:hypothetical protein